MPWTTIGRYYSMFLSSCSILYPKGLGQKLANQFKSSYWGTYASSYVLDAMLIFRENLTFSKSLLWCWTCTKMQNNEQYIFQQSFLQNGLFHWNETCSSCFLSTLKYSFFIILTKIGKMPIINLFNKIPTKWFVV